MFERSLQLSFILSIFLATACINSTYHVEQASEAVVIDLFELNPGEFTMMLRILPKTFQDGAMKVLQHHMKSNGELRVMVNDESTSMKCAFAYVEINLI